MTGPSGTSGPDERRRSRRDRELASLYATARSLAALGEVDEVLTAIVRHAHELMGADLTYLSVLEGEHLSMRASAGVVSAAFTSAEVSSTTGIGGRVIATRSPAWVSNYLTEESIEHSPAFDQLVRDEGLIALLGVPLLAPPDRVLGILYVADRVDRNFDPDEVALLSALADHASVALENARLYDESRSALLQLQDAYRTIERSGQVHEALGRVVLTGGGEAEVATLLGDSLGGRVTMLNRRDQVVATRRDAADASHEPGAPEPPWSAALVESRRTGKAVVTQQAGAWETVNAITTGDAYLGAIVWRHAAAPQPVDVRTIERASHIVGLLTLKQEAVVQAEERLRGEVLTELIRSGPSLSSELVSRGQALGIHLAGFNAIVVVEPGGVDATQAHRRLVSVAREWHGLVGTYAGLAALALHSDDLTLTVRSLHRGLRAQLGTPVVVCGAGVDGSGFARGFALASRCARVLVLAGVDDLGTTTVENGMYAALFDPERGEELDAFLDSALGDLLQHDRRHNTVLVATLTSYFACNGNVARTAREMHVHNNTLLKRLDRVASVLGADWSLPDRALPLQLALRLHELRAGLAG
jgi:GAF domain-containing protein